jgi:hypothetical protein
MERTRASSGRLAETVVTRSPIEVAWAVAVDSPAAERAAAKYLMVTSGMCRDASLVGQFFGYYVSLLLLSSVSGPRQGRRSGPEVHKDRIAHPGSDNQHEETA